MPADARVMQLRALRMVRNGEVRWREAPTDPPVLVRRRSEGFARFDGAQLTLPQRIALCRLRHDRLIVVDDTVVSLTVSGRDCLSEWSRQA